MEKTESRDILKVIEKQGERFEKGFEKLAEQSTEVVQSVNQLASAIKYQAVEWGSKNGTKNGQGQLFFGIGALIFGLLSPMYFVIQATVADVSTLEDRIVTSITDERVMAITTMGELSEIKATFREMEAQLRGLCFKHAARLAALEHSVKSHIYGPDICSTLVSPGKSGG